MGFYLRKSVKAGPFRFNMSPSGIGVSTGIPGFRVGTGPRGSYIHMGRGGVYYRSALSNGTRQATTPREAPPTPMPELSSMPLEDTTGATVVGMSSSNPSEVLSQINEVAARRPVWWIGVVPALAAATAQPPWGPLLAAIIAVGVYWLYQRDVARRSVVLFYDVNDAAATHYDGLVQAFHAISSCHGAWQHTATQQLATTQQKKVHAGASNLIQRHPLMRHTNAPSVIKTNIAVPSLVADKRVVGLLPDRLLIEKGGQFAEVHWADLTLDVSTHQFIEDGRVPGDAQQVDTTWKYVNKRGGPDRRYKDNRELPIMLYGHVTLTAPNGFLAIWSFSRLDATQKFADAILNMTQQGAERTN